MVVLWISSSVPESSDDTLAGIWLPPLIQNSLHIPAFGALAAAWVWAFDLGRSVANASLWAWALTTGYGVVDEIHQSFVPGRTCSLEDVLLDAFGAALAIVLISWAVRRFAPRADTMPVS